MSHFDYIIIGGGSAGCVLANRLSASGKWQVCLIEAGQSDTSRLIRIPFTSGVLVTSKDWAWQHTTTPQPHCDNRTFLLPMGRTLGGTSSLNGMLCIRGNAKDYDHWASLGNTGWSYKEVLPYFKKLENFGKEDDYHHLGGPLNITTPNYMNPLCNVFLKASQQANYTLNDDFNGATQDGVGSYNLAQLRGERWSNARAYLREAEKRPNLKVITKAQVTNILFKDKRAIGVRYIQNEKTIDLFAEKEIILSAGAVNTPKLLLLSGVGPNEELAKHGINLIHELPGVGKNLQDHLGLQNSYLEKTRLSFTLHPSSRFRMIKNLLKYFITKSGEFAGSFGQVGGFIRSNPNLDRPDLQLNFVIVIYEDLIKAEAMKKFYGYTLITTFLQPKSRGSITLKNADPLESPIIDPNYFSDPSDLDAMVMAFKKSRHILEQPAFEPHRLEEFRPGKNVQADDEIREYIRRTALSIYHLVGTCKMGNDKMAVVDPALKVHGIQGLRVVDASIIPVIPSGNTNIPVTMIAEKAADMILSE